MYGNLEIKNNNLKREKEIEFERKRGRWWEKHQQEWRELERNTLRQTDNRKIERLRKIDRYRQRQSSIDKCSEKKEIKDKQRTV